MKNIKIFICIFALVLLLLFRDSIIEASTDALEPLFNKLSPKEPKSSEDKKQSNIEDLNFKEKQILQNNYLMASHSTVKLPGHIDESEKQAFIEEAINDLHLSDSEADRQLAVMTLGEIGGAKSVAGIRFALHDPSNLVREDAILQISRWKNEAERLELTLQVLNGNDSDALVLILGSITEVNNTSLVKKIKTLLKHPNKDVRYAAELALRLQN